MNTYVFFVAGCLEATERPPEARRRFAERRTFASVSLSSDQAAERLRPWLAPGEVLGEVVVWPMRFNGQVLAVGVVRTSRNARTIAVDAFGHEVDFLAAKQAEVDARLATVGKMSEALFDRQLGAGDDELLDFESLSFPM